MKLFPLLLAGAMLSPMLSSATLIYGLTSNNSLVSFDSASPTASFTTIGTITQAGILDIDFYPLNGVLYGSTSQGNLYRIDTATAAATLAATATGAVISGLTDIDFNPSADRLRIFAAGDTNFRLVPDANNSNPGTAGTATLDGTFSDTGVNLVGSAYSNNFDGVAGASTVLYSIDSNSNDLYSHSVGPQFNTVNAIGDLGFDVGLNVGFDIDQTGGPGSGMGVAFLTNDQSLYTVNLGTGLATSLGTVGGTGLVSIAAVAVPEASTASVILLTGLCALRRRRA